MSTVYMMSLEDRVELARTRIDRLLGRLRESLVDHSEREAVRMAAMELQDIHDLIGR